MYDVELIGLHKNYREVVAVENVSLNINKGEFLFLLGPSGCGKTTMLRVLGGFEEPTMGTIRIQGKNVNGVRPKKETPQRYFSDGRSFPIKPSRRMSASGSK